MIPLALLFSTHLLKPPSIIRYSKLSRDPLAFQLEAFHFHKKNLQRIYLDTIIRKFTGGVCPAKKQHNQRCVLFRRIPWRMTSSQTTRSANILTLVGPHLRNLLFIDMLCLVDEAIFSIHMCCKTSKGQVHLALQSQFLLSVQSKSLYRNINESMVKPAPRITLEAPTSASYIAELMLLWQRNTRLSLSKSCKPTYTQEVAALLAESLRLWNCIILWKSYNVTLKHFSREGSCISDTCVANTGVM